ncbi:MAG: acyl--CoA ligase [Acidimicrobiia bacterium]|nr:acyl--CoA ligase [Acidimicrobiia bacterium]
MTEPRTTVEVLRQVAAEYTDTDAFVTATGERLSFGEWDRAADGIAAGLADRGVGPGDVVCLLMPSSPEYMVCYQAIMRLGAITSGINPRLGRDEVAHILDRCEPRLTIVGDGDDRGLAWLELREAWDADAPPLPAIDANQPTLICWTGGTTGRPRGAVFDHENLKAVAAATGVLSARFDRRLSPIPFAHVGTMTRAWDEISKVITTVITPTPWDAGENLRLIERERVTVGQGVPTQWELMLRHPDIDTTDVSSLRLAASGAGAVSADLLRRMRERLRVPVVNRYASTESGGVIAGTRPDDPDDVVLNTVGRPSDGVEVRVVDEDGKALATGEVGRVQARSAAVMRGYWRDPEATAQVLDPDGWVTIGDLGRLDGAGNLTLVGRVGDSYVRGGYNVYPAEVEGVLSDHPHVSEVAVVGVPDPVLGQIGVAFVVAVDAVNEDDLKAWVRARLADYKAPDRIVVVAQMPMTSVGKIDKRALLDAVTSRPGRRPALG